MSLLPAVMLMPSPQTAYTVNSNTYVSNGQALVFNAAIADIPGLTNLGGQTLIPRNNVSATVAPTGANDFTQLYGVGSIWVNVATTNPTVYVCTVMTSSPGGATWTQVLSNSTTADVTGATVTPTGASTARTLGHLFADQWNNVKTFGAAGDGTTNDTTAINNAITAAFANGAPVFFPPGHYKVTSQISVDLHNNPTGGAWLIGSGMNQSIIDGSATGGFQTLAIFGSGGTPSVQTNCFFSGIRDLGVKGLNNTGAVFTIGTANFADALNSCEFRNLDVLNTSTAGGGYGTQVNYVLDSVFSNIVSNCGGRTAAAALYLGQSAFNTFIGGSYSTAGIGIYLTGSGFNFANTFTSTDIENVNTCVFQDAANGNGYNVFYGGQYVWNYAPTTYAIKSSTAPRMTFRDINFAPANGSGGLYTGPILDPSNQIGVEIFGNYGDGTTPAGGTPATGTTYPNQTGQAQTVTFYSNKPYSAQINYPSGPIISVGDTGAVDSHGDTFSYGGTVTLQIRPTYNLRVTAASGTVNWLWFPGAS